MKKAILSILLLLTVFSAAAQVSYQVEADRKNVRINTTAVLECDEDRNNCPVNSWKLEWTVPENAEILGISDSIGGIEDYQRSGNTVTIETNQGERRTSETIKIRMRIDREAKEIADGLYTRTISLPSFSDTTTSGKIRVEDFLSADPSRGLKVGYTNETIRFKGEGAASIKVNFGTGEKQADYTFFGSEPGNASLAYRVAVATTGLRQSYSSIPVAVLPNQTYEEQAAEWSEGEYSAGIIRIRENADNFPAVLAEETVHAFNDGKLGFDRTSSSYLDEGLAGYVQSQVRKATTPERPQRKLFGDSVRYDRVEADRSYSRLPSKGSKEKLWNYYRQNMSFMKSWRPQSDQNREFGYAYSELIIRNYVMRNNSIKNLYRKIGGRRLDSNVEKWKYYSGFLDLTPCKYSSRQKFENCLDKVNSYDYPVYSVKNLPEEISSEKIDVRELDFKNHTQQNDDYYRNEKLFNQGFISSVIDYFAKLWKSL